LELQEHLAEAGNIDACQGCLRRETDEESENGISAFLIHCVDSSKEAHLG